jgi:hypothetical protein
MLACFAPAKYAGAALLGGSSGCRLAAAIVQAKARERFIALTGNED